MKKIILFVFIFFCLAVSLANAEEAFDYNKYGFLEIRVNENTNLNIEIKEQKVYKINYITTNLTFFPRTDDNQFLISSELKADPSATITQKENYIIYLWEKPEGQKLSYSLKSNVKTINSFRKIRNKVNFPIAEVPPEYYKYATPTEFIDLNKEIKDKTYEIVEGETDLYVVVFKVAEWVRTNVNYDLTTLTAKAVQKSSWVFENRRGVCDEITNLFISMMRSVGVPARFVAGQAFSNINNKFGNHGWAEVYLPGEGWIPVDVTFGEYGWINPTHIKFQENTDSGEPSVNYYWESYGIDIKTEELKINSEIIQMGGEVNKEATVELELLKDKVGLSSFVPLKVKFKNPNSYYVPLTLYLTKAPGLEGENFKAVLLKPLQEKNVFFMLKTPETGEEGTAYIATVEAKTNFGAVGNAELEYAKDFAKTDKQWAEGVIKGYEEREKKEYSPELALKCQLDKQQYYEDETAMLQCNVENKGNTLINNLKLCVEESQCKNINLGIAEKKMENWTLFLKGYDTKELVASAESQTIAAYAYVKLKIIKVPSITISQFSPSEIEYNKITNVTFTVASTAPAKNIKVIIKNLGRLEIKEITKDYSVQMQLNSKNFYRGIIEMEILFEDEAGKPYKIAHKQNIKINNTPWYLVFWMWLDSLM